MEANKIICNNICFYSSERSPEEMADVLGLGCCEWQRLCSRDGFRNGMKHGNVLIYYNHRKCAEISSMCEISERGCLDFEQETTLPNGWNSLFKKMLAPDMRLVRVGLVYEDHTHLLDGILQANALRDRPSPLIPETTGGRTIAYSHMTRKKITERAVQYGNNRTKVKIKFKQTHLEKIENYFDGVGVEVMLRRTMADEFLDNQGNIGGYLAHLLSHYFNSYVPDYWDALINEIRKIKKCSFEL